MLRRQARLRREYLYRKSLEGKEREEYEKKRLVKQALAEGKPLPTELQSEEGQLMKGIDADDDNTGVARTARRTTNPIVTFIGHLLSTPL